MRTETKRVEVSIGENMMTFQTAVLAVGFVRWAGGIRVPVTNSLKCKFCKTSRTCLFQWMWKVQELKCFTVVSHVPEGEC